MIDMVLWFGLRRLFRLEREKVVNSFKDRDRKLEDVVAHINNLNDKVVGRDEIVMMIENIVLKSGLSQTSQVVSQVGIPHVNPSQASQSQVVPSGLYGSQETIETKMLSRLRRNKKGLVMGEIAKLSGSLSVVDMMNVIVKEKRLCSKASFYRYLSCLKSHPIENSEIIET